MRLTPSLLERAGIESRGLPEQGFACRRICHDSRRIEAGDLFVGIQSGRRNGSDYYSQARDGGAAALLLDRFPADCDSLILLRADDPAEALVRLARLSRDAHPGPRICVTGSAGKTSTKEFLRAVLSSRFRVFANRGNFNNRLGLAISLVEAPDEADVLVLELGTSGPGEIEVLARLAQPSIAVVTLIGHSHLERLPNLDAVLAEKMAIARPRNRRLPLLVINGDDDRLSSWPLLPGLSRVDCALSRAADWGAEILETTARGSRFRVHSAGRGDCGEFFIALPGAHMVRNALLAIAVGASLGIEPADMVYPLRGVVPVGGRMRILDRNGVRWLDDSYNANPDSVVAALAVARDFSCPGRRWLVLGDMLELGAVSTSLHRELGLRIAAGAFDRFIAVGPAMKEARDEAERAGMDPERLFWFAGSDEAAAGMPRPAAGDLVLLKGSRGMCMERILDAF